MKKWRTSQIMMACGLAVLLVGCVLSYMKIEPWADYVLVAGAVIVVFRGAIRSRERKDEEQIDKNQTW